MKSLNMKKIIVIGCPGSGKSTLARKLHEKIGIDLHYLDMMYWNEDKTTVPKSVFLNRLRCAMDNDEWIIDGNFSSTMDMRMAECDTVIFLDLPADICLDGVRKRMGTARPDMPWVEKEEDAEFMEFIKCFGDNERPRILELIEKYKEKNIITLTSREDIENFILSI